MGSKAKRSLAAPGSLVELLQQMISFDTVNRVNEGVPFVEGELAAHLEALAEGWGLQTARLPIAQNGSLDQAGFNLLVTHEVDQKFPWLLFDSHLDTVTVEGMTIDPFGALVEDGKIYGRGACDTKGTGACMLWALKSAVEAGGLQANIAILFSVDEEVSRIGVSAFVQHQLASLHWTPSAVIVGEPTTLQMITAHNGTVRWKIETQGRAAHSSDPSQGRSAITDMIKVIGVIEAEYIPKLTAEYPLVGTAQCSINMITGGSLVNVIPEFCTIEVDRRLVPGEDAESILPAVETVLQTLAEENPELNATQQEPHISLALPADGNQVLKARVGTILESFGFSSTAQGAKYGTHASDFAALGIPSLVLGPGDIDQAHRKDEYIALDQLESGMQVYQALMAQPGDYWSDGR
ncbi:MAG: M20 family metallopeptidase [Pirellulales bacterium]|nr:M20 family metallopeptidase [Pirellulales bacterium]